jgi:hypothetical protein
MAETVSGTYVSPFGVVSNAFDIEIVLRSFSRHSVGDPSMPITIRYMSSLLLLLTATISIRSSLARASDSPEPSDANGDSKWGCFSLEPICRISRGAAHAA